MKLHWKVSTTNRSAGEKMYRSLIFLIATKERKDRGFLDKRDESEEPLQYFWQNALIQEKLYLGLILPKISVKFKLYF